MKSRGYFKWMDVLVYKGKKGFVNNIGPIADIIEVLKLVFIKRQVFYRELPAEKQTNGKYLENQRVLHMDLDSQMYGLLRGKKIMNILADFLIRL